MCEIVHAVRAYKNYTVQLFEMSCSEHKFSLIPRPGNAHGKANLRDHIEGHMVEVHV
jgi:hypothetical protein